jgi:hypothetical protein
VKRIRRTTQKAQRVKEGSNADKATVTVWQLLGPFASTLNATKWDEGLSALAEAITSDGRQTSILPVSQPDH